MSEGTYVRFGMATMSSVSKCSEIVNCWGGCEDRAACCYVAPGMLWFDYLSCIGCVQGERKELGQIGRRWFYSTIRGNKTGNIRITVLWCVTLQPLLQRGNNEYYVLWVCVCSLTYPACNAHPPHCCLWPVRLYRIFPHCHINGTIFGKTLFIVKYVFWSSLQIYLKQYYSKKN